MGKGADAEYVCRVKIGPSNSMGSINFADPANIRQAHEELMTQVILVINKKIQIEAIRFQWDSLLLALEKDFSEILSKVSSCSCQ